MPSMLPALLAVTEQAGVPVCITATLRTFHEQDELHAQGRTRSIQFALAIEFSAVTNSRQGTGRP